MRHVQKISIGFLHSQKKQVHQWLGRAIRDGDQIIMQRYSQWSAEISHAAVENELLRFWSAIGRVQRIQSNKIRIGIASGEIVTARAVRWQRHAQVFMRIAW